ncbi:OmpA family protein [Flagellimonas pacifica]|uniref:Outer membrane protein OmpA n=1 Tax=Flagellimonas pacifica TaxID=1247520 RepID=A0A285MSF3_9FLAO|nr:OmpA family protein [Allomuricauda parva]SNY99613.1 Outer membrane protein OmpA [Allomuricauda parva]
MKSLNIFATALILLVSINVSGQDVQLTKKDSIVNSFWMITLGTNIVDDSGDEFGKLLDIEDGWNMVPFPSRLSVGRYFKNGLGLEAIGSYNRYKEGKIVDNITNPQDVDYLALDFRVSYDLNMILGETGFFDPYVGIGAGYTDANNQGRGTYNAVVGFRTWFSDHWGLDFNSTGKWAMDTGNATNHIQHAVAVAYRFNVKKGLSRKGEEKLALLKELEEEQQRVQDSIASKQKADKEARLLAERLEKEKEAARIAAEKAKQDAEDAKRAKIKSEIEALRSVYFSLNSSYLTDTDKTILNKLISILQNNPSLVISVGGHTDSRGSDKYNQWLSEKRAQRTVDYVISKGIPKDRIQSGGYGENKLTNECEDGVTCNEDKHSKNRRSEIEVVSW